jgi:branched-chain amino acid transport system ATP-binding protein
MQRSRRPISEPMMNLTQSASLLAVEKLNAGYGAKRVLSGIGLEVRPGEIVVVVGPNGAGKTTLLSSISGLCRITAGQVVFGGVDVTRWRADKIAAAGIAHCPEGRQIFQRLTVEENLKAAYIGRQGRKFESIRGDAFALFPILEERRHGLASRLSGGQQQMLAIGRALMAEPELLMLDEPSLGLAPKLITQIFRTLIELSRTGISILVVEQNIRLALEVGDYAYVLESGRNRLEGPAETIAAHASLADLYLAGTGVITE